LFSANQISCRYRVEVQAVHKDDKAKFFLWDSHVTSIVGMSAEDLKEEMIKVKILIVLLIYFVLD
jgi:hypothetical protein